MSSTPKAGPELAKATSVFLDLLRIAAALTVFLYHCLAYWRTIVSPLFEMAAHRAVMVFFVLSGYVIAYSTFRKKRGLREFVVARLSRLYSVVLPALVLTLALYWIGRVLYPDLYHTLSRPHDPLRYLLCVLSLQSIWDSNSVPASNLPFWSLGYEFWYYAFFGAVVLVDRTKWRVLLVLGMALLVGPSVLLLMPCWVMGVIVYLGGRKRGMTPPWAWIGLLFSTLAFAAAYFGLPDLPFKPGLRPLLYANGFISDTIVALALSLVIWFFEQALAEASLSARWAGGVRFWADRTFSLYLYHLPLVFFVEAAIPFNHHDPGQVMVMIALILAIIVALSLYTESKRPRWAQLFDLVWGKIEALFPKNGKAQPAAAGDQPSNRTSA